MAANWAPAHLWCPAHLRSGCWRAWRSSIADSSLARGGRSERRDMLRDREHGPDMRAKWRDLNLFLMSVHVHSNSCLYLTLEVSQKPQENQTGHGILHFQPGDHLSLPLRSCLGLGRSSRQRVPLFAFGCRGENRGCSPR